jgi:DnaJ-class molecular chaperone
MTVSKNYYYILGLSSYATEAEIKRAYHQLVQQYHPDHDPSPRAEKQFKEITEAYGVLIDPDARAEFDERMKPPPALPAPAQGLNVDMEIGIGRLSFRIRLTDDVPPDSDTRR